MSCARAARVAEFSRGCQVERATRTEVMTTAATAPQYLPSSRGGHAQDHLETSAVALCGVREVAWLVTATADRPCTSGPSGGTTTRSGLRWTISAHSSSSCCVSHMRSRTRSLHLPVPTERLVTGRGSSERRPGRCCRPRPPRHPAQAAANSTCTGRRAGVNSPGSQRWTA